MLPQVSLIHDETANPSPSGRTSSPLSQSEYASGCSSVAITGTPGQVLEQALNLMSTSVLNQRLASGERRDPSFAACLVAPLQAWSDCLKQRNFENLCPLQALDDLSKSDIMPVDWMTLYGAAKAM